MNVGTFVPTDFRYEFPELAAVFDFLFEFLVVLAFCAAAAPLLLVKVFFPDVVVLFFTGARLLCLMETDALLLYEMTETLFRPT